MKFKPGDKVIRTYDIKYGFVRNKVYTVSKYKRSYDRYSLNLKVDYTHPFIEEQEWFDEYFELVKENKKSHLPEYL